MYRESTIIINKTGLHARPATNFVKKAQEFESEITLHINGKKGSGKSLIGILALGADKDAEVTIEANGVDEREAAKELKELLDAGCGE